jgi:hypothetical protein
VGIRKVAAACAGRHPEPFGRSAEDNETGHSKFFRFVALHPAISSPQLLAFGKAIATAIFSPRSRRIVSWPHLRRSQKKNMYAAKTEIDSRT